MLPCYASFVEFNPCLGIQRSYFLSVVKAPLRNQPSLSHVLRNVKSLHRMHMLNLLGLEELRLGNLHSSSLMYHFIQKGGSFVVWRASCPFCLFFSVSIPLTRNVSRVWWPPFAQIFRGNDFWFGFGCSCWNWVFFFAKFQREARRAESHMEFTWRKMSFPSFNWKLCLCYLVVPRLSNLNYVLEFKEDTFCFYSLRHLSVVIAPCSKKCQKFTLYVHAQPGMPWAAALRKCT